MNTPIQRLIEELKVNVHNVEKVIKMSGLCMHSKNIYKKEKETLIDVILNLECNYLDFEIEYLKKLKK